MWHAERNYRDKERYQVMLLPELKDMDFLQPLSFSLCNL